MLPVIASAMVAVLITGTASATTSPTPTGWAQPKKIAELTVPGSDELGFAVAMSGDGNVAVVGSTAEVVFVFTRAGKEWRRSAELTAADGSDGDLFGSSVAVSRNGSTILVGATERHDAKGAAYVFTRLGHGWKQTAELTAARPVKFGGFGLSLSVSADGSTALVGATGQGIAGEAYVLRQSGGTWTQTAALTPSDGSSGDVFGRGVALSPDGTRAVIGAPLHSERSQGVGAVYVFGDSDGDWSQIAELASGHRSADDLFGFSVAMSRTGSVLAVTAQGHHNAFGAAYVFLESDGAYSQADELTASDGSGSDFFGASLAVNASGSVIAVGANLHHHEAGAVYVFTRSADDWSQKAELVSTRRRTANWFGDSTGLSSDGSTLLVGAFARNANAGSAFVFTR